MTGDFEVKLRSLIAERSRGFKTVGEAFAKTRFMVAASEYGDNPDEQHALAQISDAFRCDIVATPEGVRLMFDTDNNDPGNYLSIVEGGMPPPLSGGNNGIVTLPDGSTRRSRVPEQLQGQPIEEYAEPASDIMDELETMLGDLFADYVNNAVDESKSDIIAHVQNVISNSLRK